MRYPQHHKQRTRERIVGAARSLFAAHGYAATSIEDVMAACGLTRGGFYRHFASKGQLYAEATRPRVGAPRDRPAAPFDRQLETWLDQRRLARLAADTCSEDAAVRRAASRRFEALLEAIERRVQPQAPDAAVRRAATAMWVGTLAIAQAQRDPQSRARWLQACEHAVATLCDPPRVNDPGYLWTPAA